MAVNLARGQARDFLGVRTVVNPEHQGDTKRPTEVAAERKIEKGKTSCSGLQTEISMNNPDFLSQGHAKAQGEKKE
jgi:hypothetical protein